MWWWWLLTKGHFVSRVGAEEGKVVVASQAIPRSHCHIMLIPSTQPYCALLCIPNLIEFLVYNPIYPKQYTPTVQTGEIAVNGWANQPQSYQPSSTPHNWVDLGIFYHYCSKALSFKTTGYLAYPALIFCAVVEVKFLSFYLLSLHWSQKLSFWTNSVVLPDIGCNKNLFDYYWFGDVKIQYGKSKFIWWWVISSQV